MFSPISPVDMQAVPQYYLIQQTQASLPLSTDQQSFLPVSSQTDRVDITARHYSNDDLYTIHTTTPSQPTGAVTLPTPILQTEASPLPTPSLPIETAKAAKTVDSADVEKAVKRLRATLNKVSRQNLAKLSQTLSEIAQGSELLEKLISLIFDRVSSQTALAELYSLLVKAIQENYDANQGGPGKTMHEVLDEISSRRLKDASMTLSQVIGNAKFMAQLYICGLLSTSNMIQVCDVLLIEGEFLEEKIEAFCHLFMMTYTPLAEALPKETNGRCKGLLKLRHDPRLSRRVQYMVQEVVDSTQPLHSPLPKTSILSRMVKPVLKSAYSDESCLNDRPRTIKFKDEQPIEEQARLSFSHACPPLPILKARISIEVKV